MLLEAFDNKLKDHGHYTSRKVGFDLNSKFVDFYVMFQNMSFKIVSSSVPEFS